MQNSFLNVYLKYEEELHENIFRAPYINTIKFLCNTLLKDLKKKTVSELVQKIKNCVK
jgi:hypothetical protein